MATDLSYVTTEGQFGETFGISRTELVQKTKSGEVERLRR
jgi:hypothetical protein